MDENSQSPFRLLMKKEIYAILDGDRTFEDYKFGDDCSVTQIAMPYLKGSDLCKISKLFGASANYDQKLSRWEYLENLFEHCIKTNQCTELLSYLFSKQQFSSILSGHDTLVIEDAYNSFIQTIIKKINESLYFGDYELITNEKHLTLRKICTKIEIQTPEIKNIDREYVRSVSSRAAVDIRNKNFDSAITKSRTLLEEVFCYAIEKKGMTPPSSGNMGDLYKRVKELYNMHGDANTDRRINTLLSGLEKIVSSISEMRNKGSDAHGVGATRIAIKEHHAQLFVNAAMAMADFILSVEKNANAK
ncbi:MAG: abortive infection family protein [Thermoguttaceae bacterium]